MIPSSPDHKLQFGTDIAEAEVGLAKDDHENPPFVQNPHLSTLTQSVYERTIKLESSNVELESLVQEKTSLFHSSLSYLLDRLNVQNACSNFADSPQCILKSGQHFPQSEDAISETSEPVTSRRIKTYNSYCKGLVDLFNDNSETSSPIPDKVDPEVKLSDTGDICSPKVKVESLSSVWEEADSKLVTSATIVNSSQTPLRNIHISTFVHPMPQHSHSRKNVVSYVPPNVTINLSSATTLSTSLSFLLRNWSLSLYLSWDQDMNESEDILDYNENEEYLLAELESFECERFKKQWMFIGLLDAKDIPSTSRNIPYQFSTNLLPTHFMSSISFYLTPRISEIDANFALNPLNSLSERSGSIPLLIRQYFRITSCVRSEEQKHSTTFISHPDDIQIELKYPQTSPSADVINGRGPPSPRLKIKLSSSNDRQLYLHLIKFIQNVAPLSMFDIALSRDSLFGDFDTARNRLVQQLWDFNGKLKKFVFKKNKIDDVRVKSLVDGDPMDVDQVSNGKLHQETNANLVEGEGMSGEELLWLFQRIYKDFELVARDIEDGCFEFT